MAQRVVTDDVRDDRVVAAPARRTGYYSGANIIYVLFGLLEIVLAFRFVFLLLGANSANGFVSFIYNLSQPFVDPFNGIFGGYSGTAGSINATFDPATLVAMVVYAVIAWALIRIIAAIFNRPADPV